MTQHDDDIAMYQQFDDLPGCLYKRVAADNERLLAKLGELERIKSTKSPPPWKNPLTRGSQVGPFTSYLENRSMRK